MKTNLLIVALLIGLLSCNTAQKENSSSENPVADNETEKYALGDSTGYVLMKQNCYMCHIERPDPATRDQMLGPPMLRIQEHYKPSYPNKNEFVEAVVSFVNNPSEAKTLMPGAVKKFMLMPPLYYEESELRLIAEAMYDYDFGTAPKLMMEMMGAYGLKLNAGEKWKLKPASIEQMNAVIKKVNDFQSDDIGDYNQLGKDVFDEAKQIMLDDSYVGEKFDQIHLFFFGIEDNMHVLMAVQSMDEAEVQLSELKNKLNEFNAYFE